MQNYNIIFKIREITSNFISKLSPLNRFTHKPKPRSNQVTYQTLILTFCDGPSLHTHSTTKPHPNQTRHPSPKPLSYQYCVCGFLDSDSIICFVSIHGTHIASIIKRRLNTHFLLKHNIVNICMLIIKISF